MADEEDLKEQVKEVLKSKEDEEEKKEAAQKAVELLTGDSAYNIPKNDRNRLADLAIKGAYIAPHYPKIVDLLSGDVLKRLSEDLGTHGKPKTVFAVLEDPAHQKQRNTIVSAAVSNHSIPIVDLFRVSISSVSNETKEVLVTALGRDTHVSNEDLTAILGNAEFSTHRDAIVRHVEARMDAAHLEEFLGEVRSVLPDPEIARLEQAIARKKKYASEHHVASHEGGDTNWSNFWAAALVLVVVLILSG